MTREFTVQIDLTLTVSATISVNATSDEDALKRGCFKEAVTKRKVRTFTSIL